MLISHSHKFLFVHVQRTGGGTVSRVLAPYAHTPEPGAWNRYLSKAGLVRDPLKVRIPAHATALYARRRLPAELWDEYFKFAVVRNPWSWIVSLYFRLKTSDKHRHHKVVRELEFPEYVDWEIRRDRRHQHPFVCDGDGKVIVDFVGRLERLTDDLAQVCERLGVPAAEELPRVGARKHKDYRDYYDDATRDKVARHWARDAELFGYDFE